MDIDFHYFATYAAAQFAGFSGSRALTIATSAQMIDENALGEAGGSSTNTPGSAFKSIAIKNEKQSATLLDYQIIQTFQAIKDIITSKSLAYKSFWPVFHFLPGNFVSGFDQRYKSKLWNPRPFSAYIPTKYAEHGTSYFPWLTRPYSPMAIALINNCRELIHDPNSDIHKYGLGDYLVGVTMHVFVDTWAHQDFVGYTSWVVNGIKDDPSYYKHAPIRFDGNLENSADWEVGEWNGTAKPLLNQFGNETIVWLGHGPAGHWPDHSSMIYQYTPGWSSRPILRNNPKEYMAAFVNMVYAMHCIINNTPYMPITVDDAFRKSIGGSSYTQTNLDIIKGMIYMKRSPDGRNDRPKGLKDHQAVLDWKVIEGGGYDTWDKNIWYFNSDWISALKLIFNEDVPLEPWAPGKSAWMISAKEATKKGYLTPLEFNRLDYFKFNIAAKFHFRFVQQKLKEFGQQLIGDWPVGFAYANDMSTLEASYNIKDKKRVDIIQKLRDLQRSTTVNDVQEGLTVMISEVQASSDELEASSILHRAISLVESKEKTWSYGFVNDEGNVSDTKTYDGIKKIVEGPGPGNPIQVDLNSRVRNALIQYKKETQSLFSYSSADSKAAVEVLNKLVEGNSEDLSDALGYIMGTEKLRPGILRDSRDCKPINSSGRLYKILSSSL